MGESVPNRNEIELALRAHRSTLLRAARDGKHNKALAELGAEIFGLMAEEEHAYEGGSGRMAGLIADELFGPEERGDG